MDSLNFFPQQGDIIMINKSNLKVISIVIGITLIFGFLASFLQSTSPLDILFISMGIMMIIIGFYILSEKTVTYFVAMFAVNAFQWLIVSYTILFINQVHLSGNFLVVLAIALVMTISLIIQKRRSNEGSLANNHKTKNMAVNKKAILISAGFLILIIFLTSFIFHWFLLELYFSSVGLMIVVYGLYWDDKKLSYSDYTPGMSHLAIYREVKNINVTVNYFLAMTSVLIFQLLIIYYITFYYKAELDGIPFILIFTFWATFYFYVQIRESGLKYIGKRRNER